MTERQIKSLERDKDLMWTLIKGEFLLMGQNIDMLSKTIETKDIDDLSADVGYIQERLNSINQQRTVLIRMGN
jgi:hypothetical protein